MVMTENRQCIVTNKPHKLHNKNSCWISWNSGSGSQSHEAYIRTINSKVQPVNQQLLTLITEVKIHLEASSIQRG